MGFIKVGIVLFASLWIGMASACNGNKNNENNNNNTENKMTVTELTQEDFVKKVYNFEANPNAWKFEGDKPAIIDFYATWCGPCKMLAPVLEEISKDYEGKIDVYKVDVDKQSDLASVFGIRSVPSLLFIPLKKEPNMVQGAMPKNELKKLIDDILLESK
ncbi:MAG: thioredoxin [Parabacteroides sp.]|nr:thioredoxin [Parabacteroides sp.]